MARRSVLRPARWAALPVLCAVIGVAGCAAIPTSGPVYQGSAAANGPGQVFLSGSSPRHDASPQQIVTGFLNAQTAGPTTDFDTAEEYLTAAASKKWDPAARVLVYSGDLFFSVENPVAGRTTTVRGTGTLTGSIDAHGVYTEQQPGTTAAVTFTVARDRDDQWRIDSLDDGLIIAETNFDKAFRATDLYFPTVDRAYLVPDQRWFPKRNWQTYAVKETLAGPPEWLAGAVRSVAPEGTELAISSVTVDDAGPIPIQLTDAITAASAQDRNLLAAQLEAVLSDLIPRSVELRAGSTVLATTDRPTPRLPQTPGEALAVSGAQIVTVRGRGIEPAKGFEPLTGLTPTAIAFGGGAGSAGRAVLREGYGRILTLPRTSAPAVELLAGNGLIAPSVDRFGLVWSGPSKQNGALTVVAANGKSLQVKAPWLAGRVVSSIRVAADGARIAVVSARNADLRIDVAGVVRDDNGTPNQLGSSLRVGQLLAGATDVVWVEQTELAVLGRSGDSAQAAVHFVPVGGQTRRAPAVDGLVSLAAGDGEESVLAGTAEGDLFILDSASFWTRVARQARLPAYSG